MATPKPLYRMMRKAWPHLPRDLRRRLGRRRLAPARGDVDVLGLVPASSVARVVAQVERDGFAVLEHRLPEAVCRSLESLATTTPARAADGSQVVMATAADLEAPRYDLDELDLLKDPAVQRLVVDPSLHDLAAAYLGGEAVSDMTAMWWSVARPGGASASAAQLFHTDRDRLSFVKFFVYLSDVDDRHGPHVYVRGSHRHLPRGIRADRRYADDEIIAAYGEDALVSIDGARGTVFVADTSGLHKGLPPQIGRRLVFQVEFTTSLFGAPYVSGGVDLLDPVVRRVAEARPRAYRRLLAA